MKTFKFFHKNNYYGDGLPIARRMSGRTIANELLPVQPLGSPDNDLHILRNSLYGALRIRECAVISASIRDFNNWRNGIFDRNNISIITNRSFTHINGNNYVATRYTAITTMNDCRGCAFDDYITTDRIEDILLSGYDDTIDYIRQIIVEVNLHTRDNETL